MRVFKNFSRPRRCRLYLSESDLYLTKVTGCVESNFAVLLSVNAGQNCSNKTTVNSGETAMLYYPTSHRLRENSTDFEWYRAYKENISFAFMNNSITGSCEEDSALNTFCKKKVTFEVKNKTHLLLQIKDTTVNDSGCYAVHYRFSSFSSNDKKERKLEVITLEVKGKEALLTNKSITLSPA